MINRLNGGGRALVVAFYWLFATLSDKAWSPRLAYLLSITAEFFIVHGNNIAELHHDSFNHPVVVISQGVQGSLFKIADKLLPGIFELRPIKIEDIAMAQPVGFLHMFDQRLQRPDVH
jgi:hypothetical protein